MTPARFEDAMAAVQAVQQLKTVVLDLGAMETQEAQRTIDFVSGGVYAMDGQSERLGETVFLFAPALVTIQRDGAAAGTENAIAGSRLGVGWMEEGNRLNGADVDDL